MELGRLQGPSVPGLLGPLKSNRIRRRMRRKRKTPMMEIRKPSRKTLMRVRTRGMKKLLRTVLKKRRKRLLVNHLQLRGIRGEGPPMQ